MEELKPAMAGDDGRGVEAAALAQSPAPSRRRPLIAALVAACALVALAVIVLGGGHSASKPVAKAVPDRKAAEPAPLKSHPKVVVAVRPGEAPPSDVASTNPSGTTTSRPASDAEVRSELSEFRQHLAGFGVARGAMPDVRPDGTAVAPLEAPDVVATVIAAGNEIATKPYKWGGGHGAWADSGYDCSGSISFALAGAGLMTSPLVAAQFMHWGAKGPGRWITIYASRGHTFMVVAGLRFDTSGARAGTRWQPAAGRSYAGFVARHPPGL